MSLFTAEKPPERLYVIELPLEDGTRKFVCFAGESVVPAWEAINCVATPVQQWPWEEES